jgi:hypothetical protein
VDLNECHVSYRGNTVGEIMGSFEEMRELEITSEWTFCKFGTEELLL